MLGVSQITAIVMLFGWAVWWSVLVYCLVVGGHYYITKRQEAQKVARILERMKREKWIRLYGIHSLN